MNTESAAILSGIVTCLMGVVWYWNERVRRVPLDEFGLEAVNRVLRFEPDSKRREILARGWMTSHEWTELNRRQIDAINLELKRRGMVDGSQADTDNQK